MESVLGDIRSLLIAFKRSDTASSADVDLPAIAHLNVVGNVLVICSAQRPPVYPVALSKMMSSSRLLVIARVVRRDTTDNRKASLGGAK